MSKDIWHSKNEIPELRGKQIIIKFQDNCWDLAKITRTMQEDWDDYYETAWLEWVYLDDLLALETELERTRKALDVAVDKLKGIKAYYDDSYADPHFVNWHIVAQRLANDADDTIKTITALEQKEEK